jgi:hypothetical protein
MAAKQKKTYAMPPRPLTRIPADQRPLLQWGWVSCYDRQTGKYFVRRAGKRDG